MSANFSDLLSQTKKQIREVSVQDVDARIKNANGARGFVLLDVREKDEWTEGHLPGAIWLPRGFLEPRIEKTVAERETPIVVYCAGGTRSAFAAKSLQDL